MPTFEKSAAKLGAVVVVPFPYTDRHAEKRRPTLVVSNAHLIAAGFVWLAMITGADNPSMDGDVEIRDHRAVGLSIPSVIRSAKIVCVEPALIIRAVGQIEPPTLKIALARIRAFIG